MSIFFLSGAAPLTKTIRKTKEGLEKDGYPNLKNFTSHEETVTTIGELYKHLITHANKGHCLLKGILSSQLTDEPRKGMMPANTHTDWVCFDLDKAPYSTPDEFMKSINCEDISYVVQYSASHKLNPKDKTLNAHIFVLLDKHISPQNLKSWLMHLNLSVKVLDNAITLTNSKTALHWPLDITTCQNDKLLYITKPNLEGLDDPIKDRIQLIKRELPTLNIARMALKPQDTMREQARKRLNELREKEGLVTIKAKSRIIGEHHVQPGVTAVSTYEFRIDNDYVRYNLNSGNSWAYWHPINNWELLHSFKGEDSMLMKEILPERYAELNGQQRNLLQSKRTGAILIAFREKISADYWKGTWNKEVLDIHKVKSEMQLDHFLQAHGSVLGPFIPEWEMIFDPRNPVVYDEENNILNTFVPTELMRKNKAGKFPLIQRIINHAVGTGETQEYFMNWLAVIVQHRVKTQISWVLHGTFGTGKGLIINHIMKPILQNYAHQVTAAGLKSQFCGWRVGKLLIMVDEIEVDLFEDAAVESNLRNWISDPMAEIEQKGRDKYSVPCFNNWIFGSNKAVPVRIPLKDRRTNVARYQPERFLTTRQEIEEILPTELSAFAHHLMTRKADIDMAGRILDNEDRRAIQDMSMTSVDEIAHALNEGNFDKLYEFMPDETVLNTIIDNNAALYASLMKRWAVESDSKVTRDQLAIVFKYCIGSIPEGKNKFTTYLKHHGLRTKKIRMANYEIAWGIEVTWQTSVLRKELSQSLTKTKLRSVK